MFYATFVLHLFILIPFASIHHFLIYASNFWYNALWLVTIYYANPYLFHYFLLEWYFLFMPLFI